MKTVLIVEDEAIIAMTYKRALRKNYLTILVSTGIEAVNSVKNSKPDLILMDIKLKGNMNGIEAARQIQDLFTIPFFFLSGNTDQDTKNKALSLNPCGYLKKPINHKELVRTVNSIIL
ncbi:MAG: response regulator [Spirochaetes bacterium]|nr:MAG: response regulator [Spirochaetota bacterium]